MPPTATLEDIKAYQQKVEKNKITPHNLGTVSALQVESAFFKLHAYRERRFLIIVEMLVKAVFCTLVRFRCPDCGKTITTIRILPFPTNITPARRLKASAAPMCKMIKKPTKMRL
jgi:hypothetical protein